MVAELRRGDWAPSCREPAAWLHDGGSGALLCHGHYERGTTMLVCLVGERAVSFGSLAAFSPLAP